MGYYAELLKYASRAANIPLEKYGDLENWDLWIDEPGTWWNPLDENEDAFILAAKLNMVLDFDYNGGVAVGNADYSMDMFHRVADDTSKPQEMRLAIVMLAAAIGKGME